MADGDQREVRILGGVMFRYDHVHPLRCSVYDGTGGLAAKQCEREAVRNDIDDLIIENFFITAKSESIYEG